MTYVALLFFKFVAELNEIYVNDSDLFLLSIKLTPVIELLKPIYL